MSNAPQSGNDLSPPSAPQDATQLAEMVGNKPQEWYDYIVRIVQEHGEIRQYADSLAEERTTLETRLEEARKQLHQSNHEGQRLQEQLNQAYTPTSTPGEKTLRSEKLPDPEPFDGKRSELQPFIASLRLKLLHNRDRFPTASERLTYAFSRLAGSARNQILPYVTRTGVNFADEEALIAHLELAFGDPDRKGTAQRQVQTLRQRNREFSAYFAEFNRYVQDTGYNDEAKKAALMVGLSEELKGLLVHSDTQDMGLQELASHCQKLDNRYRANLAAAPQSTRPQATAYYTPPVNRFFTSSPTPPSPPVYPSPLAGEPMDLSVTRTKPRGPLTPEEKRRRQENRLCYYCAQPNHVASVCPSKPKTTLRAFSVGSPPSTSTPGNPGPDSSENAPSLG